MPRPRQLDPPLTEEGERSRAKVTSFLPTIVPFSGCPSEIENFFSSLENIATYAGWTEEDLSFVLGVKLSGIAAEYFSANIRARGVKGYQEVKRALLNRFQDKDLNHDNMRKLTQSYQRPNETVREFAARIEALSFRAISSALRGKPDGDVARQEILTGVFLEGLRPQLRRLVLPQNPKSFDDAVRCARLEEDIFTEVDPEPLTCARAAPQTQNNAESPQDNLIHELSSAVKNLTIKLHQLELDASHSKNNKPISSSARCFRCNQRGHLQRDCRRPIHNPDRRFFTRRADDFQNRGPNFSYPQEGREIFHNEPPFSRQNRPNFYNEQPQPRTNYHNFRNFENYSEDRVENLGQSQDYRQGDLHQKRPEFQGAPFYHAQNVENTAPKVPLQFRPQYRGSDNPNRRPEN